nr:DUF4136 domain-containing protein [uncultured Roseateles sp.]
MNTKIRFALYGLAMAGALALSGCASMYTVRSEVTSYGAWPAERKPASFAFERLPSQGKEDKRQAQLETAATAALQKAGFSPAADNKSADVLVMVGGRVSLQERGPWEDPFWWQYRTSFWRHSPMLRPYPYNNALGSRRYEREVALVLRDRQSGEAIYETRASSDGLSVGDDALLGAMFAAAIQDFPRTVPEPHEVAVSLQR